MILFKEARERAGKTLEETAKACGCSKGNIKAFEDGRNRNYKILVYYVINYNLSIYAVWHTLRQKGGKVTNGKSI